MTIADSDRPGFGPVFHWRNGWHFQRCVDEKYGEVGEVLITNDSVAKAFKAPMDILIPAAEWASIIEHVSGYESAERVEGGASIPGSTVYAVAEAFHAGNLARGWLTGTRPKEAERALGE